METLDTILNELKKSAPVIASLKKQEVYTVPDRYFDDLPDKIMGLTGTGSPKINKGPVFTLPKGYFDNLSSGILSKIKSSPSEVYLELEEAAPLLNTVSRQNVYTVPGEYFKDFKVTPPPQKPKATILLFSSARRWVSYAAAAVMAGVLVTGAFMYTYRPTSFDVAKEVNKLSDEELDSYINSERSVVFSPDSINLDTELDVQSDLKLVSDEELQQYLQDNQEIVQTTSHKGS